MKPDDLRSLTGIRGIAALLVVLYHYSQGSRLPGPAQGIVRHSYLMVDLFFVLSGFVMMLTYGSRFTQSLRRDAVVDFLLKRLFRVYPLYIVVTLATLALVMATPHRPEMPSSGEIVANVLLVQAWNLSSSICGPSWSISTELAAYLLFPPLALILARRHWAAIPVALAAIGLLVFVATRSSHDLYEWRGGGRSGALDAFIGFTPYPLLRCIAGFALGVLAFRSWRVRPVDATLRRPWVGDALAAIALVLLWHGHADVLLVLLFAPFVMTLAHGRSRSALLTASPVVHWFGLISYSLYLVHQPMESALLHPLEHALRFLGVPHLFTVTRLLLLLAVVAVASFTYYGIERPARDGLRTLLQRPTRRTGAPVAAR